MKAEIRMPGIGSSSIRMPGRHGGTGAAGSDSESGHVTAFRAYY